MRIRPKESAGGESEWLMSNPLFEFPKDAKINPRLMNPLVLAYVGDGVYELLIRQHLASSANHRPNQIHKLATRYVSAKSQAKTLELWLPLLSEEEKDVVRRGRNAKSGTSPRNTDVLIYRHSTAMECLVGYLYCIGRSDRIQELMELVLNPVENAEESTDGHAAADKERQGGN